MSDHHQTIRLIQMMAEGFLDSGEARDDARFMRLATLPYELSKLGLQIEKDWHYRADGSRLRVYHLPRQEPAVVMEAVRRLGQRQSALAHPIKLLAFAHPRRDGSRPPVPGIPKSEWSEVCRKLKAENKGRPSNKKEALAMLLEPGRWLTVKQFDELYDDQRLSVYVEEFRDEGMDIVTEMRKAPDGKGRAVGHYHLFTSPEERAEYDAEMARREAHRKRLERENELRKQHAKDAKRAPYRATHNSSGAPVYGRHVAGPDSQSIRQRTGGMGSVFQSQRPQPPAGSTSAPTPPPAHLQAKIATMGGRPGLKDVSAPDVPAAELDRAYPRARSKEVVEFRGARYLRQFTPGLKDGEKVQQWNVAWVRQ